jgi:LPXTG-motif cell wall-anchored protein
VANHPAAPATPTTPTNSTSTLPNTGASDVPLLLGIAGALLVAGTVAVVVGTRKVRR